MTPSSKNIKNRRKPSRKKVCKSIKNYCKKPVVIEENIVLHRNT